MIPGIGYLDDLVILSVGIPLSIRMVPAGVMAECRAKARAEMARGRNKSKAASVLVTILFTLAALAAVFIFRKC